MGESEVTDSMPNPHIFDTRYSWTLTEAGPRRTPIPYILFYKSGYNCAFVCGTSLLYFPLGNSSSVLRALHLLHPLSNGHLRTILCVYVMFDVVNIIMMGIVANNVSENFFVLVLSLFGTCIELLVQTIVLHERTLIHSLTSKHSHNRVFAKTRLLQKSIWSFLNDP